MSTSDLQNDLLADLQVAGYAPPRAAMPPTAARTPAFDLRVTPLRWSRPRFATPGIGLRVGPVQVSLSRSS